MPFVLIPGETLARIEYVTVQWVIRVTPCNDGGEVVTAPDLGDGMRRFVVTMILAAACSLRQALSGTSISLGSTANQRGQLIRQPIRERS